MNQTWRWGVGLLVLGLITGCGGGGEGGSTTAAPPPAPSPAPSPPPPSAPSPLPPPPVAASLEGVLQVPPTNRLEVEPNDSSTQSQPVRPGQIVSGYVNRGDAGMPVTSFGRTVVLHDVFKIRLSSAARIEMRLGANDLIANDVDLFLLDDSGRVLQESIGVYEFEALNVPAAGNYYIGVQAYSGSSPYLLALAVQGSGATATLSGVPVGADFVPGQLLLKMRDRAAQAAGARRLGSAHGLGEVWRARTTSAGFSVMRLEHAERQGAKTGKMGRALGTGAGLAATLSAIAALRRDPAVEMVEPDYILTALRTPNDSRFAEQWHYHAVSLPQAWDLTVGAGTQVVVGVVDTGIASAHPDLGAKLVPGYDFISDPADALDGDGRDPNPEDEGDDPRDIDSSYHGTHVAGTIGAASDNGEGGAGVSWGAKIMPLRALGAGGAGTVSDISEAVLYGAGLSALAPGPRKVDILNLSLGGPVNSQVLADALARARTRGVIIVAAAGNSASDEATYPAANAGVISVSAIGPSLALASYSSFGASIDVAAPGGDMRNDQSAGVLSTHRLDDGRNTYAFMQGTYMAAPHVAGIIALMKAANPTLTPDDVDLLITGVHPGASTRITRDLGVSGRDAFYGHGLIDAALAVRAALALSGSTPVTGPIMGVSTSALTFSAYESETQFGITNLGSGALTVNAIRSDQPWLKVTPSAGSAPVAVIVSVNRSGLAEGTHTANIVIQGNGTPAGATIPVTVQVVPNLERGDVGPVRVIAIDAATLQRKAQADTSAAEGYRFSLQGLAPGRYVVMAGTDRDLDENMCDIEDACGILRDPVVVTEAGAPTVNLLVGNWVDLRDTDPNRQRANLLGDQGKR